MVWKSLIFGLNRVLLCRPLWLEIYLLVDCRPKATLGMWMDSFSSPARWILLLALSRTLSSWQRQGRAGSPAPTPSVHLPIQHTLGAKSCSGCRDLEGKPESLHSPTASWARASTGGWKLRVRYAVSGRFPRWRLLTLLMGIFPRSISPSMP